MHVCKDWEGRPILLVCQHEECNGAWLYAVSDVTFLHDADYAYLLECGHTFLGYITEPA